MVNISRLAGVYAITHVRTGRRYIGSSACVGERWASHRRDLRAGRHPCAELQEQWATEGEDAFEFQLLTPAQDVKVEEQRLIVLHVRAGLPLFNRRDAIRQSVTSDAELMAAINSL